MSSINVCKKQSIIQHGSIVRTSVTNVVDSAQSSSYGSSPESNFPYTPIESLDSYTDVNEDQFHVSMNMGLALDIPNVGKHVMVLDDDLDREIAHMMGTNNDNNDGIEQGTELEQNIQTTIDLHIDDAQLPTHSKADKLSDLEFNLEDEIGKIEKIILGDNHSNLMEKNGKKRMLEVKEEEEQEGHTDSKMDKKIAKKAKLDNFNIKDNNDKVTQGDQCINNNNCMTDEKPAGKLASPHFRRGDTYNTNEDSILPAPPPQENKFLKCFSILRTNYLNLCSSYNSLLSKYNESEVEKAKITFEREELKSLLDGAFHELNILRSQHRKLDDKGKGTLTQRFKINNIK